MKINLLVIMLVSTLTFAVCNVAQADTIEVTVTKGIGVAANDMEEKLNTAAMGGEGQGTMDNVSTDLELGSEGGNGLDWQVVGVQYDTLGIPQGATIISASITFTVDAAGNPGDNNFTIIAEAVDNSTIFGAADFNITSRNRSITSVAWAPAPNDVVGSPVVTPDISALIQEVIDRPGWSDDNLLTLMFYPDVYLALPDPTTGGNTAVQELELEADPGADSATLTVTYEVFVEPGEIVASSPFAVADTVFTLTAPGETPWEWSKNGIPISPAETNQVLTFDPLAEGDAGNYSVTLENGDGLKTIRTRTYFLEVFPSGTTLPLTGLLGLGLLASACAMGGASVLRRKK